MTIKIQAAQGVPLAQIARSLGIDRKTARKPTVLAPRGSTKLFASSCI